MTNKVNLNTFAGKILFSVVRIESIKEGKVGLGTGFIVSEKINENSYILFLVTNKHVIENTDEIIFYFIKSKNGNPAFGEKIEYRIKNPESSFLSHPSKKIDLTILPLGGILQELGKKGEIPFYVPIPNTPIIATEEDLLNFDAIEEVIFAGYPEVVYDTTNLTPIIRKGITATPIGIDYKGEPIFLVDSMVFHGSSGSPVFVYNMGTWSNPNGSTSLGGNRLVLCGVMIEFFVYNEEIGTKKEPFNISTLLNTGKVIKSYKIKELIEIFRQKNKIQDIFYGQFIDTIRTKKTLWTVSE